MPRAIWAATWSTPAPTGLSRIDVLAETDAGAQIPAAQVAAYGRAFEQAERLFGSRPYDHYDFIADLSGRLTGQGVEHQQSTEASLPPAYFSDPEAAYTLRNLLVHEYNARLERQAAPPCRPDRAGLQHADAGRPAVGLRGSDDLSGQGADGARRPLDRRGRARPAGRNLCGLRTTNPAAGGRSLQDTTVQPIIGEAPAWQDWARGADYYEEASLLWLDVDTLIRQHVGRQALAR